jgi:CopG family nickel-responsive transcriptional regulator
MSDKVSRISVSIDPDLLEEFDEARQKIGYNRSTAVQLAMRDFLTKHKWKDLEGILAGVITMMYNHHTGNVIEELTHIQHNYRDLINSSTHIHIDHQNCLEILAVKGEAVKIKTLSEELGIIYGIQQIRVTLMR